jgi:hypothetical protein
MLLTGRHSGLNSEPPNSGVSVGAGLSAAACAPLRVNWDTVAKKANQAALLHTKSGDLDTFKRSSDTFPKSIKTFARFLNINRVKVWLCAFRLMFNSYQMRPHLVNVNVIKHQTGLNAKVLRLQQSDGLKNGVNDRSRESSPTIVLFGISFWFTKYFAA